MDLEKIKEIIENQHYEDDVKIQLILKVIANNKNAIPYVLQMVNFERASNNQLIASMNVELGRADVFIERAPDIADKKSDFNKKFVLDSITKFYRDNREKIQSPFNKKLD